MVDKIALFGNPEYWQAEADVLVNEGYLVQIVDIEHPELIEADTSLIIYDPLEFNPLIDDGYLHQTLEAVCALNADVSMMIASGCGFETEFLAKTYGLNHRFHYDGGVGLREETHGIMDRAENNGNNYKHFLAKIDDLLVREDVRV
jgi:hypothetical protein